MAGPGQGHRRRAGAGKWIVNHHHQFKASLQIHGASRQALDNVTGAEMVQVNGLLIINLRHHYKFMALPGVTFPINVKIMRLYHESSSSRCRQLCCPLASLWQIESSVNLGDEGRVGKLDMYIQFIMMIARDTTASTQESKKQARE